MDFGADVIGINQLYKTFNNLPRAMQRKAYRQALRAGAAPVKAAAEANLRAASEPFSGLSRRRGSIAIYNLKKSRGNFRVSVQVKRGLVNPKKKGKDGTPVRVGMYLAVLEYGSNKINRAPRSWIRKAIRENVDQSLDALTTEMSKRMVDVINDAKA